MNKVYLYGRLWKDPDGTTTFTSGSVKGKIHVAIDRDGAQKKDDGTKPADFIPVITWGKTAENCAHYLHKGSPVIVEASIRTGQYKTDNGETRFTMDVVATRVDFLPDPRRNNGNPSANNQPQAQTTQDQADPNPTDGFTPVSVDPDDLPF